MRSRRFLPLALLFAVVLSSGLPVMGQPQSYFEETPIQRDTRMQWWRDATFGMFIHWGLYAVPAGTWQGERIPGIGEWIMASANISVADYEPLAKQFNPVKFDAAEWVRIAKAAGMKYLVITSKHHDGFSLWDSEVSTYDVMDATPFKRDILGELAVECRKQGVRLAFYHSILDWHHPAQFVNTEAERPRDGYSRNRIHPERKEEYVTYMKAQLRELVTRYDPAVLWFDGEWTPWWTEEDGKDLYNYVRSLKEDIIINNRVGKGRAGMSGLNRGPGYAGDFGTPEQEIPDTGQPGIDWESCMTMNDTWGFKSYDDNWKSARTLLHNLVDIASKGGNYLLNVGPTAEGLIPQASVERLQAMGGWLERYSESVYLTEASPYERPEWGRFTRTDPNILYAHVFEWPGADGTIDVPVQRSLVERAELLTPVGPVSLGIDEAEGDLRIALPDAPPDPIDSVIRITLKDRW